MLSRAASTKRGASRRGAMPKFTTPLISKGGGVSDGSGGNGTISGVRAQRQSPRLHQDSRSRQLNDNSPSSRSQSLLSPVFESIVQENPSCRDVQSATTQFPVSSVKINHVANNEQSQLTNTTNYLGLSPSIPESGLEFSVTGAGRRLLNDSVGIGEENPGAVQSDDSSCDSEANDDDDDDGGGKMAASNIIFTGDDGSDTGSMNDYSANNYPLNERVSFFMERRAIASNNRAAVEAAYIIEALTLVRSAATMKKPDVALKVQETYKSLIHAIPNNRFADDGIKTKMLQGYFRAKKNSPAGMLIKAEDTMGKVRAMAASIQGIGTPLHKLPSGKGLRDVWMEFVEKKYKEHLPEVSSHVFIRHEHYTINSID